ncbi:MAG: Anhydro-N-acetylmuramic acid kinase [Alphaproteobacteria bacterium MarineAlpha5_Bin9]|nr:MAG: Anhydro-N-acetylmuramic acid kinase [Alphaproteobacteria bacterium MarineAlpha5_Bin9]
MNKKFKLPKKYKNKKNFNSIGVMSGTSIDGIDLCYMKTNGTNKVKIINEKTYKYRKEYVNKIKKFIKNYNFKRINLNKKFNLIITKEFQKKISKFLIDFKIKVNKIDFIVISGQTIIHNPKKKLSIQYALPKILSNQLKVNIIYDLRQRDILAGGQGAPIASYYHKYLSNKINKKVAFINIGGISNISYINNNELISFDLGPGNSLVDDFVQKKFKKNYDFNGIISNKGKCNNKILNQFLKDSFFKKKYPKSLDREYFNKYFQSITKINKYDALTTLSMMTVKSIYKGIKLLNKKIDIIILTGGGRKNQFFYNNLKNILNKKIITTEQIGLDGDLIEAQAFAYIGIRSVKNLPLSKFTTTGVSKPISGGEYYLFN